MNVNVTTLCDAKMSNIFHLSLSDVLFQAICNKTRYWPGSRWCLRRSADPLVSWGGGHPIPFKSLGAFIIVTHRTCSVSVCVCECE